MGQKQDPYQCLFTHTALFQVAWDDCLELPSVRFLFCLISCRGTEVPADADRHTKIEVQDNMEIAAGGASEGVAYWFKSVN